MRQSEIIKYYSREDIQKEIVRLSQGREVIATFQNKSFGKRPDMIQFPAEVKAIARKGATSFHASEERWLDPLKLKVESSVKELDNLRSGWDFVIDIDCKILDYSKDAAALLIKALKDHNINCYSVKFSGGSGFHIGVPFEAMPKQFRNKNIELLFPDAARIMAEYLSEYIKSNLADRMLNRENDLRKISELTGKLREDLIEDGEFNPYSVLEIDAILISSRHLFRMPYSLNEKKWLSSVTINPEDIDKFDISWAVPANVTKVNDSFLNPSKAKENEINQLLVQAFDWKKREALEKKDTKIREDIERSFAIEGRITEENFPPCIKLILNGLEDGRKRSLFILINFLRSLNWEWSEIESKIIEWNKNNREPLKIGYIRSQLNWSKRQNKRLPPNCDNKAYYLDIGICKKDQLCSRVKNSVTYSFFKVKGKSKRPKPS